MSHKAYLVRFPRGAKFDAGLCDVVNQIIREGGRVTQLRPELDGVTLEVELRAEIVVEGKAA